MFNLQVYVEDALGDRVWVDLESCKELTANICTLFGTKAYVGSSSTGGGAARIAADAGKPESTESGTGSDGGVGVVSELNKEVSGIETAQRYTIILNTMIDCLH